MPCWGKVKALGTEARERDTTAEQERHKADLAAKMAQNEYTNLEKQVPSLSWGLAIMGPYISYTPPYISWGLTIMGPRYHGASLSYTPPYISYHGASLSWGLTIMKHSGGAAAVDMQALGQ